MIKKDEILDEVVKEESSEKKSDEAGITSDEAKTSDEVLETEKQEAEEKVPEESDESDKQKEESDRYIRLLADFQNYKNRVEKQKSEIYSFANEKIITKLLDVLDNFHRALDAETEDTSFKEGMEMILNQLKSVLIENGLSEIEAEEKDFDPNLHNAVMVEEVDGVEENKVVEVFQKGYTLNSKVIRPSMVKVSK